MTKISFDVDFSEDPETILKQIQDRAKAEVDKRESKEKVSTYLSKLHEKVNDDLQTKYKSTTDLIKALTPFASAVLKDKLFATSPSGRRKTISMDKETFDKIKELLAEPNPNKAAIGRESGVSVVQVRKVASGGYDEKFEGDALTDSNKESTAPAIEKDDESPAPPEPDSDLPAPPSFEDEPPAPPEPDSDLPAPPSFGDEPPAPPEPSDAPPAPPSFGDEPPAPPEPSDAPPAPPSFGDEPPAPPEPNDAPPAPPSFGDEPPAPPEPSDTPPAPPSFGDEPPAPPAPDSDLPAPPSFGDEPPAPPEPASDLPAPPSPSDAPPAPPSLIDDGNDGSPPAPPGLTRPPSGLAGKPKPKLSLKSGKSKTKGLKITRPPQPPPA